MIKIINENNIQKKEELLYREWIPIGKFVKILVLFVCLLIISVGIIISAFRPKELAFMGIIFGAVSLFIFLMYWNFRGLKIILTNNQLEVVYGIFNHKRIPYAHIFS